MAMPAMSPNPTHSPLSHCISALAQVPPLATVLSYATLAPPRSSSTTTMAGDRAPRSALDAARVAPARAWTRSVHAPRHHLALALDPLATP